MATARRRRGKREALSERWEESLKQTAGPNHGRRISLGGRSAVLNATDQKKKDEARAEAMGLFVWDH